jgi:hypothetical protein
MALNFTRVAISMQLSVPDTALERHLAASPRVVAENMAEQVINYEREHGLGYYPAIDFFQQHGGVEPELIDALENISWVLTSMVRNEIRLRLRPVFSQLKIESLKTIAFTMPTVRPGQQNDKLNLINHFSATSVKVNLIATLLQKIADPSAAAKMAESMCYRWLKEHFAKIEVTSVHVIENDGA